MTQPQQPSVLVTVVAWVGLLWSGFTTVMGLLQSVVVSLMPTAQMTGTEAASVGVPAYLRFIFDHMLLMTVGLTLIWAFAFACSLGLLRRHEWARRGFIGVLLTGVIGTVVLVVIQQLMMGDMFGAVPTENANAGNVMIAIRAMSVLFGLVLAAGMAWVAMRLNSADVRAEFHH